MRIVFDFGCGGRCGHDSSQAAHAIALAVQPFAIPLVCLEHGLDVFWNSRLDCEIDEILGHFPLEIVKIEEIKVDFAIGSFSKHQLRAVGVHANEMFADWCFWMPTSFGNRDITLLVRKEAPFANEHVITVQEGRQEFGAPIKDRGFVGHLLNHVQIDDKVVPALAIFCVTVHLVNQCQIDVFVQNSVHSISIQLGPLDFLFPDSHVRLVLEDFPCASLLMQGVFVFVEQ